MLIVSKFHDYYDSVIKSVGIDKTVVYNRATTELSLDKEEHVLICETNHRWTYPGYGDDCLYIGVIGFCGKLYPCAKYVELRANQKGVEELLYDIDEIKKRYWQIISRKNNGKISKYTLSQKTKDLEGFLAKLQSKKLLSIFIDHKVPVFYSNVFIASSGWDIFGKQLLLNPSLSDIKFVKKFHPQIAFQEIHMYIGGVLGTNEKETIQISNKDRIVGHGFDYKTSFRKEKIVKRTM